MNQNGPRFLVEFVTLWPRILNLCLKLLVLQYKVAILTQKRRVFLFQRRHLLREQRSLLVQKVNHVLGESGSGSDAGKLFNGIGGTHE